MKGLFNIRTLALMASLPPTTPTAKVVQEDELDQQDRKKKRKPDPVPMMASGGGGHWLGPERTVTARNCPRQHKPRKQARLCPLCLTQIPAGEPVPPKPPRFKVGDRVHYPGAERDGGTVIRQKRKLLVHWDDDHIDPIGPRGKLLESPEGLRVERMAS
jgi:hypothetical protein